MTGHRMLHDGMLANYLEVDPGNAGVIRPTKSPGMFPIVTTAAQTRTVPDPTRAGLTMMLAMKTDGGDCVVTAASTINAAGNTIMTFGDAGDFIELVSIPVGTGFKWRIAANEGVALS